MDQNRIERIKMMEARLDRCTRAADELAQACERWKDVAEDARTLSDYYQYGEWMEDHDADETGELPKDLKRGVLSEDSLYDFLLQQRELTKELLRVALSTMED